MSVVIEFRLPDPDQQRPAMARGPAEIIIFNGVRFERLHGKPQARKPRSPKGAAAAVTYASAEEA